MRKKILLLFIVLIGFNSCKRSIYLRKSKVFSKFGKFKDILVCRYSPESYLKEGGFHPEGTRECFRLEYECLSSIADEQFMIHQSNFNGSLDDLEDSLFGKIVRPKYYRTIELSQDTVLRFKQIFENKGFHIIEERYSEKSYTLQDIYLPNYYYVLIFYNLIHRNEKSHRAFKRPTVNEQIEYKVNENGKIDFITYSYEKHVNLKSRLPLKQRL